MIWWWRWRQIQPCGVEYAEGQTQKVIQSSECKAMQKQNTKMAAEHIPNLHPATQELDKVLPGCWERWCKLVSHWAFVRTLSLNWVLLNDEFYFPLWSCHSTLRAQIQSVIFPNSCHHHHSRLHTAEICSGEEPPEPAEILVVDEAHRARNGRQLHQAIQNGPRRRLLVTATPSMNSRDEFYTLMSLIAPLIQWRNQTHQSIEFIPAIHWWRCCH